MGRYERLFSGRHTVVERDGTLFAGDVQVTIDDAGGGRGGIRLSPGMLAALRLFDHARLHCCQECKGWFIAHHAARICSDECHKAARIKVHARASEKRRKLAAWARADNEAWCPVCDRAIPDAVRSTRRYCSNKCRQTAYRLRVPERVDGPQIRSAPTDFK